MNDPSSRSNRRESAQTNVKTGSMSKLTLAATLMAFALNISAAELTLTQDGKSDYVIVIPANPIAPVQTASRELKLHFEAVTGAKLPVLSVTDAPANQPKIILGGSAPELATLKHDGIILRTNGKDILLTGEGTRGTLYAVYTFLEDIVGVRWWSLGETFLPKKPTLTIPELNTVYSPQFWNRSTVYRRICNVAFAAKLKVNGHVFRNPEEYGGFIFHDGFVHTFNRLIPANKYFADHPDWFGIRNGKRQRSAQRCLTNEEMRKEMTKNALIRLRRNKVTPPLISISQDDHRNFCLCEPCQAISKHEGTEAGPIIHFVNKVAEDIEKEFPDVLVETLAYSYTTKAPKHIRPRKNVLVRLCSIAGNFAQPLATDERNQWFQESMKEWSAISTHFWVWDYVDNMRYFILPHPNLRVLAPNMKYFADNKVTGMFVQGNGACSVTDFQRLRQWVLAHLLWNPQLDGEKLINEFLHGYYGKAGPHLKTYLDYLHDVSEATNYHLSLYENGTTDWLKPEHIIKATQLYQEAEAVAKDDEQLARKIRRERLTLDLVWIRRWQEMQSYARVSGNALPVTADQKTFTEEFLQLCRRYRANMGRGTMRKWDDYDSMLRSWVRGKATTPDLVKDLPAANWLDVQDFQFNQHGRHAQMRLVDDPQASDGKAARMPGNHAAWSLQYWPREEAKALGKVRAYMSVRFEAKTIEGLAMSVGVYDLANRKHLQNKRLPVHHEARDGYQFIDLGTHDLSKGKYFWAAPPNRNTNDVAAVYIDRILLVKEQ